MLLFGTLPTIAAGLKHPRAKYMLAQGILLFVHVFFHVVFKKTLNNGYFFFLKGYTFFGRVNRVLKKPAAMNWSEG